MEGVYRGREAGRPRGLAAFKPELSMGWVDPRVGLGWVGNGSRIFVFSGLGLVMGLKWQSCEKQMSCTYVTMYCQAIPPSVHFC